MSDITPADALRELRDGDYPDYVAAAAKKLGLPESVEYVEMRTEYGVRYTKKDGQEHTQTRVPTARTAAEYDARLRREHFGNPDARVVVREVITTAWREVTP